MQAYEGGSLCIGLNCILYWLNYDCKRNPIVTVSVVSAVIGGGSQAAQHDVLLAVTLPCVYLE